LNAMMDAKKSEVGGERLSVERSRACLLVDNPEFQGMIVIAEGMELFPSLEYVGCTYEERPSMSRKFIEIADAVEP
jgi:hypothetical protein